MMKNILLPGSFTLDDIDLIKKFLLRNVGHFNIIISHNLFLSDSLTDLLFISRSKYMKEIDHVFISRMKLLQIEKKKQIASINYTFIFGTTNALFKNFLYANCIDAIILPEKYVFKKVCKFSYDPISLIRNSGLEIITIKEELQLDAAPILIEAFLSTFTFN